MESQIREHGRILSAGTDVTHVEHGKGQLQGGRGNGERCQYHFLGPRRETRQQPQKVTYPSELILDIMSLVLCLLSFILISHHHLRPLLLVYSCSSSSPSSSFSSSSLIFLLLLFSLLFSPSPVFFLLLSFMLYLCSKEKMWCVYLNIQVSTSFSLNGFCGICTN